MPIKPSPKASADDLLAGIPTVGYLKDAVAQQEQSIQSLSTRLDRPEARFNASFNAPRAGGGSAPGPASRDKP